MGRLFWKFFLFIWLAQLAGVIGTGALFWLERQPFVGSSMQAPPPGVPPEAHVGPRPPPEFARSEPPRGRPLPLLPIVVGLFASLLCAAGLAWYFAKPIRQMAIGGDFDRMTERLQRLVEGQQRLLHDVSHEMRSPLARLQAAIGLARQQPARMEDSLRRIEREGERMDRLVGELLTLSRLEAGAAAPLEAVDIDELLLDIVEDARFEGGARRVSITYDPRALAVVQANGELLQRAIENVMRNAIRHSPDGGTVAISTRLTDGGQLRIRIADHGPGVPEAQLEAIFQPFFRGDGQGGGYGLGLAIARRVISALGGTIRASRGDAGGLVVDIKLPLPG